MNDPEKPNSAYLNIHFIAGPMTRLVSTIPKNDVYSLNPLLSEDNPWKDTIELT